MMADSRKTTPVQGPEPLFTILSRIPLFVAILEQTGQLRLQRLFKFRCGFHRALNRFVDLDQFVDCNAVHRNGAL